ncbi:hypothetical protein BURPS668_2381 [Burkholderia pseudomallei 668]|nr:hypothetical protein BURPS668_2381 [Burkholderia pseudomallei 668]
MSDNEDNARRMSARPCTPHGAGAWAEAAHAGRARGAHLRRRRGRRRANISPA